MGRGSNQTMLETGTNILTALTANHVDLLPEGQLEKQLASGKKLRIKFGIDPTAPDIHLGHVVVLKALRRFQDAGHQVVLIIGDQTTKIGDPSGKSKTRPMLTDDKIQENIKTFEEQAFKILDKDPEKTEIRFNSEWLDVSGNKLIELLSQATVSQLIERDDFSKRLNNNQPIALSELVYPVLQAYDSVMVESDVELGGTDQKFNLLMGRQLQTRLEDKPIQQTVMTMPILTGTDGKEKMSKSLNNYIGVTDEPKDIYGKTMSIPDSAMPEYYRLLLDRELDLNKHPRDAKRELARELVATFYSDQEAEQAEADFINKFVKKDTDIEAETVEIKTFTEDNKVFIPNLVAEQFGITKSEVRRIIKQNGLKLDGEVVKDVNLSPDELKGKLLTVGKKRFCRLS